MTVRAAVIGVLLCAVSAARAATLVGSVTLDGRPAQPAVVYLESPGEPAAAPSGHVIMDQRNLAFVPAVLPVVRGTVVEFTNSDDVQHNVFSPSAAAGKFDLGTHGPGATRVVTLNELGDVLVLCNIHMEMAAHILVLKDPYFALVARDGRYRIQDVPSGTYTLRVWHERVLPQTQTVELPASGSVTIDLPLPR